MGRERKKKEREKEGKVRPVVEKVVVSRMNRRKRERLPCLNQNLENIFSRRHGNVEGLVSVCWKEERQKDLERDSRREIEIKERKKKKLEGKRARAREVGEK